MSLRGVLLNGKDDEAILPNGKDDEAILPNGKDYKRCFSFLWKDRNDILSC